MDNRILVFLLSLGAILLATTLGIMIGLGDLIIPCLIVALSGVTFLVTTPKVATFATVALFASGLTAPGLPNLFGLAEGAQIALIGIAILLMVFGRASLTKIPLSQILLIGFCLIVFITGVARGFGFRFLGSNLWGGGLYIEIFLSALLVFALPRVNMPANWWPVAIVTMGALSLTRLLAEILFVKTGASFVTLFVHLDEASTRTELSDAAGGGGVGRLMVAGLSVGFMIIAFLATVDTSKLFKAKPIPILIFLGIVALSLLSGYRLITLVIILTVILAAIYQKALTWPRIFSSILVALVLVGIIYSVSDSLPISMQRAVSWLPNINISSAALGDADQTVDWRLDVWRAAIQYIPEYFWIGKGLAFDGDALVAAKMGDGTWDPISWALIEGAYHNGYLSLLLLFGIFGLILGIALLVTVLGRMIRFNNRHWKNQSLKRCYQAFLASLTATVMVYLTVYGDVAAVFPNFLFTWAIMEGIRACDENQGVYLHGDISSPDILEEDHAYIE